MLILYNVIQLTVAYTYIISLIIWIEYFSLPWWFLKINDVHDLPTRARKSLGFTRFY